MPQASWLYAQTQIINAAIEEYDMPTRTPAQKARRRERDAAKRLAPIDIALARIAALEKAGAHWYVVAKSPGDPCKQCGLFIGDRIHKDAVSV